MGDMERRKDMVYAGVFRDVYACERNIRNE